MENQIETLISLRDELSGKLKKVQASIRELSGETDKMHSAFTRPLEHVAVHMFGMQLLQTLGIAEGARPVLMVLQIAVTELAGAFNLLQGATGICLMGFAALAAMVWKVSESHSKAAEAVKELDKAQGTAAKGTQALLDKFIAYHKAIGDLPKSVTDFEASLGKLSEAQKAQLEITEKAALQTVIANKVRIKDELDLAKAEASSQHIQIGINAAEWAVKNAEKRAKAVADLTVKYEEADVEIKEHVANLVKLHAGGLDVLTDTEEQAQAVEKLADATKKVNELAAKELESIRKQVDLMDLLTAKDTEGADKYGQYVELKKSYTEDLFESLKSQNDAWVKEQEAREDKRYKDEQESARKQQLELLELAHKGVGGYDEKSINDEAGKKKVALAKQNEDNLHIIRDAGNAKAISDYKKLWGIEAEGAKAVQQIQVNAVKGAVDGTSSALAKGLVQHKSIAQSTKYLWRDLAEGAVQSLIKMAEQAVISSVIQSGTSADASAGVIAGNTAIIESNAAVIMSNTALAASNTALTATYVALAIAEKAVMGL